MNRGSPMAMAAPLRLQPESEGFARQAPPNLKRPTAIRTSTTASAILVPSIGARPKPDPILAIRPAEPDGQRSQAPHLPQTFAIQYGGLALRGRAKQRWSVCGSLRGYHPCSPTARTKTPSLPVVPGDLDTLCA
jgi:hypothetical protein